MAVVLSEYAELTLPEARAEGEGLWLSPADLERATGWSLKPEGLCKGDVCMPLPSGQRLVSAGQIDAAALWRHLGRPVLHGGHGSDGGDGGVWSLGTAARERADTLRTLAAPDFALPDRTGTPHRLSDFRGRKVLLVTWASW